MLHQSLTHQIIACYYRVYNTLGYGFLEKVYENAMILEFKGSGLRCDQQMPIEVLYTGQVVGSYFSDIIVENVVILELKAAKELSEEHEAQLINYLKATRFEVGVLLNFGKTSEFKRKVFSNQNKSFPTKK